MIDATLLEELKRLQADFNETLELQDEHEDLIENTNSEIFGIKNKYEKNFHNMFMTESGKLDNCRKSCLAVPTDDLPEKRSDSNNNPKKVSRFVAICGLSFYAAVIYLVLSSFVPFLPTSGLMLLLYVFGFFVGGIVWFIKNDTISDYDKWVKNRKEWIAKTNSSFVTKADLLKSFRAFDQTFATAVAKIEQARPEYRDEMLNEIEKVKTPALERSEAIIKRLGELEEAIDGNKSLHDDYKADINEIMRCLESGRADSLKEAIGIVLEDARKAAEERERRNEARRQELILERQAREAAEHNRAMERAAEQRAQQEREHARIMEQHAKAQAEETHRLRAELERQRRNR